MPVDACDKELMTPSPSVSVDGMLVPFLKFTFFQTVCTIINFIIMEYTIKIV